MRIKPSLKQFFYPLVVTPVFCSFAVFISIYIFEREANWLVPLIIGLIILIIFTLLTSPMILFESITLTSEKLIYKKLSKQIIINIDEIREIYEKAPYRRGFILVFSSRNQNIEIVYQAYQEDKIRRLIKEIHHLNPKIKNDLEWGNSN